MIITYPNPILKKQSVAVENIKSVREVVVNLKEEIAKHPTAVGISAPQIGENLRIICVMNSPAKDYIIMINPKILKKTTKATSLEGCLSCPGERRLMDRYDNITVKYVGLNGKTKVSDFRGLTSYAIQHEIDHLNGKLIMD